MKDSRGAERQYHRDAASCRAAAEGRNVAVDLVERAQRGDHAAFDALATGSYHRLYGIARRILRDEYAAQDAVQDTLIRAWRDLRGLRDRSRFDAWIHRLLVHACADQARRERRHRAEIADLSVDRPAPGDDVRTVADRDELERAFLKLSLEHRAVLVLVHYAGMSAPEVARVLGVPAGTVYSRLHYGTRQMREILAPPTPVSAEVAR
jgi:RNA polymerase sigma-70 factor (ECF subfamily)